MVGLYIMHLHVIHQLNCPTFIDLEVIRYVFIHMFVITIFTAMRGFVPPFSLHAFVLEAFYKLHIQQYFGKILY